MDSIKGSWHDHKVFCVGNLVSVYGYIVWTKRYVKSEATTSSLNKTQILKKQW